MNKMTMDKELKDRESLDNGIRKFNPDQPDEILGPSDSNIVLTMESLLEQSAKKLKDIQNELQLQLTERSMVEAQLRADRDKMHHYLDIAGVIIMVIDCDGNISLSITRDVRFWATAGRSFWEKTGSTLVFQPIAALPTGNILPA